MGIHLIRYRTFGLFLLPLYSPEFVDFIVFGVWFEIYIAILYSSIGLIAF